MHPTPPGTWEGKGRYCGPCDRWWPKSKAECPACGADTDAPDRPVKIDAELRNAMLKARIGA